MSDDCVADLAAARDRIASVVVASTTDPKGRIGRLTLRPHQTAAVTRILDILARYRGALLADAVGLGKTYVALAIAREHERPIVVCPAALRPMWERAMATAGVTYPLLSVELLARRDPGSMGADLVIIDEAHHFRTPTTRRYDAVARLASRCRVLLLSATPVHNSRRDLTALLALFLGSDVHGWSDGELARVIVRRDESALEDNLPDLMGPHPLSPGADDDCLDAICALPVAVPAADEGTAGALAAISLIHLWSSSRAALVASVRSRLARAIALREAIASGHLPTAVDLAAWHYADGALQLAFSFCVGDQGYDIDVEAISSQLDRYVAATVDLLERCRLSPDPDVERAALLRALMAAHRGARIVAFSQYAHTVEALGALLRSEDGIAIVTASGGRIASGSMARQEILDQFAGDAPETARAARVDLLLSTDLLSEGVDLRGASVIVNLDLPWNPGRLEQRVGRARRIGSRHSSIHVYTFVPPAAAEHMLRLQQRLAAKVRIARGVLGGARHPAVADEADRVDQSPVAAGESLRVALAEWLDPLNHRESDTTLVAAATARTPGWIAVVDVHGLSRLIHSARLGVSEDPDGFRRLAKGIIDARPVKAEAAVSAVDEIESWASVAMLRDDLGAGHAYPSAKRAVLARLSQSVARAPRHRRAPIVAAAQRARAGIAAVTGIGVERILEKLVHSVADDEAWIESVERCVALHASTAQTASPDDPCWRIGALILLEPLEAD